MPKKNNQGGGNDVLTINFDNLTTLSKEQLLEIAEEEGIDVDPEVENEVIIKAITDFFVKQPDKAPEDNNQGSGDDDKPPAAPPNDGKKQKIKCEAMKGKNLNIGNGVIVHVDENGIAEVPTEQVARLLSIPGWEAV